jgi:hypothetical protein
VTRFLQAVMQIDHVGLVTSGRIVIENRNPHRGRRAPAGRDDNAPPASPPLILKDTLALQAIESPLNGFSADPQLLRQAAGSGHRFAPTSFKQIPPQPGRDLTRDAKKLTLQNPVDLNGATRTVK